MAKRCDRRGIFRRNSAVVLLLCRLFVVVVLVHQGTILHGQFLLGKIFHADNLDHRHSGDGGGGGGISRDHHHQYDDHHRRHLKQNRSILLVHIGKSGGLSLSGATRLRCLHAPIPPHQLAAIHPSVRPKTPEEFFKLKELARKRRAELAAGRTNLDSTTTSQTAPAKEQDFKTTTTTTNVTAQERARQMRTTNYTNGKPPPPPPGSSQSAAARHNSQAQAQQVQAHHPPNAFTSIHVQDCIEREFSKDQVLARQTFASMHMWTYTPRMVEQATSLLFTLRHPVDRIISAYRYHHPENCVGKHRHHHQQQHQQQQQQRGPDPLPGGCRIQQKSLEDTNGIFYKVYKLCFPSPAMQPFADSVLPPYDHNDDEDDDHHDNNHRNETVTRECRSLARSMVRGDRSSAASNKEKQNSDGSVGVHQHHPDQDQVRNFGNSSGPAAAAAPHMYFNFYYYVSRTLELYPNREVLVVRTEHEHEDMSALDRFLGGSGMIHHHTSNQTIRTISHGSEYFRPSPVSTQAYHKLCCVLHDEMDIYLTVLERAVNLNETDKNDSRDYLWKKCGITGSYNDWKKDCQKRLQEVDADE